VNHLLLELNHDHQSWPADLETQLTPSFRAAQLRIAQYIIHRQKVLWLVSHDHVD
jgi:hypothetical protein